MKININNEKLIKELRRFVKLLPGALAVIVLIVFVSLSYIALSPNEDESVKAESQKKIDSLNIQLSPKMFSEMGKPNSLKSLEATRNPFAN